MSHFARGARAGWSVLGWTATSAAVLAVIAAIGIMIVPKLLGWHGVVVLSGSMEPTLKTGGVVFFERATAAEVEEGDIITFKPAGLQKVLVTHRVIEVIRDSNGTKSFRTKGDANSDPDGSLVQPGQLIGKVRFDLPYMGRVIQALHNRENYYFIIGIPAVLLILNELWTVRTEYLQQRRKGTNTDSGSGADALSTEGVS